MSAWRRMLWCVFLVAWPAWAVIRTVWHPVPGISNDIGDIGAGVTFGLGLSLLIAHHAAVPRLRDWRQRKQIRELRERMDGHETAAEAQFDRLGAEITAMKEGLSRVFTAAGKPVPPELAVDEPTQPLLYKIIG